MTESAPVAWQEIGGQMKMVQVSYVLLGNNEVGFSVGAYDHSQQLVIDPTLTWNTFLGVPATDDQANAIAVDSSGNVYVAGTSNASWGSPILAFSGGTDAFVAKINSSGNLVWNTFLGGTGNTVGNGIALDSSANVYVAGTSSATWGSPVQSFSGGTDAFAAKLSSGGSLTWSTFVGGAGTDQGNAIAVNSTYVGGGRVRHGDMGLSRADLQQWDGCLPGRTEHQWRFAGEYLPGRNGDRHRLCRRHRF